MNINTSGIVSKLTKHADILAFLAGGYTRYDGDLGRVFHHYISGEFLQNLRWSLKDPKFFLWDSEHEYTTIFKGGAYLWLAAELGILNKKYQTLAKKVMIGGGIAAMTLPGSHGAPSSSSGGNGSYGY